MFVAYITTATADPSAGLPKVKAFTDRPCVPKDLRKNLASDACCSSCYAGCNICRCGTSCPHVARLRETTSIICYSPVKFTSAKFCCSNFMIIEVGLCLNRLVCAECPRVHVSEMRFMFWETLLYLQPSTNRESQKLMETRTNVLQ
jgi:hypothetical protein